jgi:hypothetical protein
MPLSYLVATTAFASGVALGSAVTCKMIKNLRRFA